MAAGKTFYDILGVSKSASDKEIKSAFRQAQRKNITPMPERRGQVQGD